MMSAVRVAVACLVVAVTIVLGFPPFVHADWIINYDFEAYIDGRDLLVIKGNTLQWHHLNFAAVGRHQGSNEPTIISASINGTPIMNAVEWVPRWSSPPPDEIRQEEWSSVFDNLNPPLPNEEMDITLRVMDARGSLSIHQMPTVSNDFTLILDFNDNHWLGSAWYSGGVTLTGVSRPSVADVFNMPDGVKSLEFVTVSNPGNANDTTGFGAVDYGYAIGKYEVTVAQYTSFLNAVASTDAHGLYRSWMHGIERGGEVGSYTYTVTDEYANRPVNFVSWGDAARFVNWLHNGQPTGAQDLTTTEDGSYLLNGATTDEELSEVVRRPNAKYWIPSEDEWYKAAYYDPTKDEIGGYWLYPTRSDSAPGRDMTEATSPGNNVNYFGEPHPIDDPYHTTEVGQFYLSDSYYGTFDQGGNLWEWNEADWVIRGGSFSGHGELHTLRGTYRFQLPLDHAFHDLGFRVATVPEPSSIAMLAGAGVVGLGLAYRRRRRQKQST